MPTPKLLSSLLLATSLLLGSACSTTTRGGVDGGVVNHPVRVHDPDRTPDRGALRALLIERREQTVARFLAYREARVYPINSYQPGLQHVWLDEQGHLCAAATVISADWGYDVTAAVAREDNFVRLADVTDGPLAEWMLTSGLTHHELVAIQEPMEYPGDQPQLVEPAFTAEQVRLYAIYTSVERQIDALWDESLDQAVDALVAHPELARRFLAGELPGAGRFAALAGATDDVDVDA